jgi:perosamine synthetase
MIPIAEPLLGEEELNNVTEAVKSGWISSKGKFIPEFEEKFARYCGVKHGVATSNGTASLHLALTALGIKHGDEVIIPTFTFIATANAVTYLGAKPVFVDAHPDYWCIAPEKIEEAITTKTRAIIPVHLYGHPCDMDAILAIARKHDLFVIEDAAEAHGAEYKGKKVGSFGEVSCFSFFANKIITTGEGGMCLTNDKILADTMRSLRDHGMSTTKRYWHDVVGFNYRMTNLQAAVGVAQLEKIDAFIDGKRNLAKSYVRALQGLSEMRSIKLHPEMPWAKCVYWLYSILIERALGISRDNLMGKLRENEIESRPFFYPVHTLPPYKSNDRFPIAEQLTKKGISLPSSLNLDEKKIKHIVKSIGA